MISTVPLISRFLALYAVLLVAFAMTPIRHTVGTGVAWTAAAVLGACSGISVGWSLDGSEMSFTVPEVTDQETGTVADQTRRTLDLVEHTRNVPLFVAIILVAARVRGRSLLLLLVSGSVALILLDGLIVAADAWRDLQPEMSLHPAYHLLAVVAVFHLTGAGIFAAPVFLGAVAATTLCRKARGANP